MSKQFQHDTTFSETIRKVLSKQNFEHKFLSQTQNALYKKLHGPRPNVSGKTVFYKSLTFEFCALFSNSSSLSEVIGDSHFNPRFCQEKNAICSIVGTTRGITQKLMELRLHTHGNVFLRFCIVSSNELVVLDSLKNSKQYKNAGKRFRVYGAWGRIETKKMGVLDYNFNCSKGMLLWGNFWISEAPKMAVSG